MLVKLFKYDMKSMGKSLFPLYAILLIMSFFSRLAIRSDGFVEQMEQYGSIINVFAILRALVFMVFIFIFAAVIIVNLVVVIKRFSSNLLGDEGYLMNTLPVRPWQNITSKLLSAFIYTVLSSIAAFIAILILVYDKEVFASLLNTIADGWEEIREYVNLSMIGVMAALMAIAAVTSGFYQILVLYASVALGHLANTHRKLMSFVAFIGINFIINTVSGIFSNVFAWVIAYNDNGYSTLEQAIEYAYHTMTTLMSLGILISLVISIILFAVTNYILSRKLNLE